MNTLRDHFWLWGHEAGSHNDQYKLTRRSRITPTEAALYMDLPNVIMVAYGGKPEPPYVQCALPMGRLDRLVWSIVGDSSSIRNNQRPDVEEVCALSEARPNLCGAIMDDFFHKPDAAGSIARFRPEELAGFRQRLRQARRPLDLWVVVYTHDLDLPMQTHLAQCDVITFWTWNSDDLAQLPQNFARMERAAPKTRKVLGCYMYDYGPGRPMPLDRMKFQCEQGVQWLREGRIEGMIFLASCICDLDLETVEWTRRWIAEAGGQTV